MTPEYKTLPGWSETTYGVKDGAKLPKAAAGLFAIYFGFLAGGNRNDFDGTGARRHDCAGGDAAGALAVKPVTGMTSDLGRSSVGMSTVYLNADLRRSTRKVIEQLGRQKRTAARLRL